MLFFLSIYKYNLLKQIRLSGPVLIAFRIWGHIANCAIGSCQERDSAVSRCAALCVSGHHKSEADLGTIIFAQVRCSLTEAPTCCHQLGNKLTRPINIADQRIGPVRE